MTSHTVDGRLLERGKKQSAVATVKMNHRQPHTSLSLRRSIVDLHKANISPREISRQLGVDKRTVYRWICQERQRGNIENLPRSGRPRSTTPHQDQLIIDMARRTPLTNAVTIRKEIQTQVAVQTVRNRLHEAGIHHRIPAEKPFLTAIHQQERLGFALQYYPKDAEFWQQVIFCDEKTFASDDHGSLHCWRPANTR